MVLVPLSVDWHLVNGLKVMPSILALGAEAGGHL